MEGHAKKCVERHCELANRTTQQLCKVSTPCIDDHHFEEEELKLSKVCSKIVLKCLYLARIGRPDILWSVNKLARSVTKWTKACDKRLSRLISYIHHTCEYKQYCHVGNTAKQCRLGLFQDSDFAGDLEDSKSWLKSRSNLEDPVVPLERHLHGHPLAGLLWERQFEEVLLGLGRAKVPNWECLFAHRKQGLFLSVYVDDFFEGWKTAKPSVLCERD